MPVPLKNVHADCTTMHFPKKAQSYAIKQICFQWLWSRADHIISSK